MKEKFFIQRRECHLLPKRGGIIRSLLLLITSVSWFNAAAEGTDHINDFGYFNQQQAHSVSGIVTDKDGLPLEGVTVSLKGSALSTTTNAEGRFTLSNVSQNATLVFTFVGKATQEVSVSGRNDITISMETAHDTLGEVVAIGYGSVQKRKVSGSVTNITPKDFNRGVNTDAVDLLRGRVAGLTVTQSSGDVTAEQTIRIRGTSSLTGSSAPFVVIDGVPGMSINSVAPQDIASISILKDASAAAIYGSRSGSGVIMITTKNGVGGKSLVEYNTYIAKETVSNKPDLLNAAEWRDYTTKQGMNTTGLDLGGNTDWFSELLSTGTTHNHDLSLSGGGKDSRYRASLSYLKREGVVIGNNLERINARMTFSQKALNNKVNFTITGAATQRDYSPAFTGNFDLAYNMIPVYPVRNADGSWFDILQTGLGNPVRNLAYNRQKHKNTLYYLNARADIKLLQDFTFSVSGLKERENDDFGLYLNSETGAGRADQGLAQRRSWTRDKKLLETTLSYQKEFGDHAINVLTGYSYEQNNYQEYGAQNRQFTTDFFLYNNLGAGENLLNGDVWSSANMYRLISFFGRVNYDFLGRYIVTATVRRDGSSKFGANHKWGTFPSVSAAWRLVDEPFLKSITSGFSDLKVRASYGISGNQDGIDPYRSLQLYGISGQYYNAGNWYAAYKINQNANPDLKWEQTEMFNVGLDFATWNNRLSGTIEFYNKKTKDLLFTYEVAVPPFLYSQMLANVGAMSNKGIEVLLTGDVIRKKDLTWTVSVNFARNKNTLTSLSNDLFSTSSIRYNNLSVRGSGNQTTHILEEGRPVGSFYGWRNLRLDDAGKFVMDDMVDGKAGLTNEDWTYIGDAQPDYTFGISSNLNFKNFDFSFFLRGVQGHQIINVTRMRYASTLWLPGANVLRDALSNGLKDNPRYSSYYIEDGSFIRLDNASIGYNFNVSRLGGINKLRLYLSGQNLFVITKYTGLDPEVNMDGLNPGIEASDYYPKARTISLGVNVSF